MRAWRVEQLSGISALSLVETGEPAAPGPGEATVEMIAVGLNYPDLLMLTGRYQYKPPLPFTPGMEGVGRVVALGEGISGDLLGTRVLVGGRTGLLAERTTLPLENLRPAPEALSDEQAAGFTTGALTAWVALAVRGRIKAGEHLLVLGAGGGMGLSAVSVGRALGATVTAAASTADKRALAMAAGAHAAVEAARISPDFANLKGSCDIVFDPVGGALVQPALKTLRWGGRYLVVGFTGGPPVGLPTNVALLKGIELLGVRAGEYGRQDPDAGRRHIAAIDRLAANDGFRPQVGLVVPFEQAPIAFQSMQAGVLAGKAIIRIGTA